MPVGLKMSAEIHDWLADLRDSDPPAAFLVGQALTALAGREIAWDPRWWSLARLDLIADFGGVRIVLRRPGRQSVAWRTPRKEPGRRRRR
jgi:hypothetical protein